EDRVIPNRELLRDEIRVYDLDRRVNGTKSGWLGNNDAAGSEMLLGLETMRRLTEKRSPMEAKSRKLGGEARYRA
ncbi:unnamed protein product, partial [Linum tenue]